MAYMISCMISYLILDMISCLKMHFSYFLCIAAADPRPAQHADETDDDNEPGKAMDIDEERDFADQGPLTDMDMEEDAEILSLLLKHMPSIGHGSGVLDTALPTRSGTGATAAGSTR